MTSIDFEALGNAVLGVLDDRVSDGYDLDTVLRSAVYCWDDTGIQVKGKDFSMVFSSVSYELLDYEGLDCIGE